MKIIFCHKKNYEMQSKDYMEYEYLYKKLKVKLLKSITSIDLQ